MICSVCGHENQKNKFCVHCGAALTEAPTASQAQHITAEPAPVAPQAQHIAAEPAPTAPQAPRITAQRPPAAPAAASAPNEHLENAKRVSLQYFAYFGQVLRHPFETARNVQREQFVNGIITIVLLSLLYPLLIYIGLSKIGFGRPPFGRVVVEPAIYFLIIFALISGVIFLVVRLSGVAADFRSVAARFGTLLIPATLCVAVTCLFFLLEMSGGLLTLFFSLGLIFLFMSITVAVMSFQKRTTGGLDTLYAVVIANVASGYILYKVISLASNAFGGYFMNFGGGFPRF